MIGVMFKPQFFYYVPTILLTVVLGLIVFINNPKKLTNRMFLLFSIGVLGWLVSQFIADVVGNTNLSLTFIRWAVAFSIFIGFAFVALIDALAKENQPNKKLWLYSGIIFVLLVPVAFLPTTVESVSQKNWGVEATYGDTYLVFLLYIILIFLFTLYLAFFRKNQQSSRARTQILFVYWGIAATLVVNIFGNFILLPFGLPQQAGVAISVAAVLFIVGFTGYAILKHRLFNIRAIVARSLAYVFSIGAFALIYAFLTFGLAQGVFLKNVLTTELSREIFNVVLAVLLAFTFPTIRRFFEKITDRVFYRDRYDPQQLVSDIGRVLASEILLEQLSSKVLAIIDSQMRLATSNIVVMGEDGIFYQTHADKIQQLYHAPELAKFNKGTTIVDELSDAGKREILDRHNVRAVFPLRTKESFVGYLLLGEKQSGDIFSTQDVQTLQIISDELAIAINNARSYQEIQRFNETLREKVRLATAELRHANSELKELDKAKDEFISMASHQLRTPLTAVRGYTSMVMDGDFGNVSNEQKDTLKQSFDAATRMTRLVDDLLNVSRIQSGKFKIERTEVDLNKVLPEEVSMLGTAAEMKHVTINFHKPKAPVPALQIDEGKTRQCLMNLMDNAIYYSSTAEGGGKVDVYLEADADWVSFKVKDNGIGVPKAEQAKLFQKFYRAPNAQKTRPDGTGLGLFLVGRVTKDQGGEIIFESEEGKGSTFGFKLPIKPAGEDLSTTPSAEVTAKPEAVKK